MPAAPPRCADLNFLYLASRFLEFAQPQLSRASLSAVVGDIRASMLEEVDFLKEAAHIQVRSSWKQMEYGAAAGPTFPVFAQPSLGPALALGLACAWPWAIRGVYVYV